MTSPLRRRLPRQRLEHPRIQLNVLRLDADGNSIYDDDDIDPNVCNCFPDTSSTHIPSMLYDHIHCPHHETRHIQPAQEQVFAYPWTAHTQLGRKRKDGSYSPDSLASGPLSVIAEEGHIKPTVTRTAPPFANQAQLPNQRVKPPFTAPVHSNWADPSLDIRRVGSVPSLTGFQKPPSPMKYYYQPSSPYVQRETYRRPATFQNQPERQFDGQYVDPKDGQVYRFRVNYGKKKVEADRHPERNRDRLHTS